MELRLQYNIAPSFRCIDIGPVIKPFDAAVSIATMSLDTIFFFGSFEAKLS
jgi:hypothetical protein